MLRYVAWKMFPDVSEKLSAFMRAMRPDDGNRKLL
jgi:hypothetical protein